MRTRTGMVWTCGFLAAASLAMAQRPGGPREGPSESADDFVARMMEADADKDGKLTKAEVADGRLQRLFARADADKDEVVTKEELTALFAREAPPAGGPRGGGGPGGRGPGGFGPPGGGGRGGPPQPGQILPGPLQDQLELTEAQKAQLTELQKDVDARLEKILTAEQKARLREMRGSGPGGFGPPGGGPGRPGGGGPPPPPGGPPPEEPR